MYSFYRAASVLSYNDVSVGAVYKVSNFVQFKTDILLCVYLHCKGFKYYIVYITDTSHEIANEKTINIIFDLLISIT